jgi:hypothetical protein
MQLTKQMDIEEEWRILLSDFPDSEDDGESDKSVKYKKNALYNM